MELGRTSFRVYPLRYTDYAVAREDDLARERELAERQQAFVDKTEDFIRKNIAGQKTKQAQSRRKMLDKLDRAGMPEDVWAVAEKVAFRFAPAPRTGDIVLDAKGLFAARGGRSSSPGSICWCGAAIASESSGRTARERRRCSSFSPERARRKTAATSAVERTSRRAISTSTSARSIPLRTAVEEVRSIRGDLNVDGARQYLARFRFYGDDPLRKVQGYSGGERSRLCLAKLLLEPRNLLFLDEPTNHLDIPAAEILEEALIGFEGTVVLVSHDRRFLENVTTRTIAIREGACDIYPGGFRDFVENEARRAQKAGRGRGAARRAIQRRACRRGGPAKGAPPPPSSDRRKKATGKTIALRGGRASSKKRRKHASPKGRSKGSPSSKISSPPPKRRSLLLRDQLKQDPGGNWEKIANLAREEQALSKRVESMMSEWTMLCEEVARNRASSSAASTGADERRPKGGQA